MLFHVITHTNELLPKMNHVVATPGPHKAQPKCNVVWSFSAALRCTLKVLNLNDTSENAPNQNVRPQRSSVNSLTDDGCQHLSCSILADLGSADSRKGIPGELLHRSCALPIFQFKHCLELKHCRQVEDRPGPHLANQRGRFICHGHEDGVILVELSRSAIADDDIVMAQQHQASRPTK